MRYPISTHARLVSPLRPHLSIMQLWVYGGEAHSSGRQNETWLPARWRGGGMGKLGGWWDEMRGRRDGENTHPADCGGWGCRSPLCMSTLISLAGEQRRGGCGQTISKERDLWGKKESWREGEVEILVLLAQALLNGLFGLAHEAAVADCCCLAVCCSDMQDYTMCSHTERERERYAETQRERDEREGRREVKGLK